MKGKLLIEKLLAYAGAHLYLREEDVVYLRNVLLSQFGLTEPYTGEEDLSAAACAQTPDALAEELAEYAQSKGLCCADSAERYVADVFGLLTPLPSEINRAFAQLLKTSGPSAACRYLYAVSVANGYVKKTAIARNIRWEHADGGNRLEITINLSKLEKNNRDVAKALLSPQGSTYPACALCRENEGFEGSGSQPPRRNIRTVKMRLGGQKWFMQYSPYAYYEEHCIVINEEHVPMAVDGRTPDKLLDFVDLLPCYFVGSNAALPIIGGSILTHEHFQGGLHRMPMFRAGLREEYAGRDFPGLKIGIPDWYNSVIRCEGTDRAQIAAFAARVIATWKQYDCLPCELISHTDGVPHNALAPVCRKEGDRYIFEMILRNNRTDARFPGGIFHAHPEYANIKSEGIGLIEAMGLFILPPRLKRQLSEIESIVCGETGYDKAPPEREDADLYIPCSMIGQLMEQGIAADRNEAHRRIQEYVGRVCIGILVNTAVFKNDETGRSGFNGFMESLGLKRIH